MQRRAASGPEQHCPSCHAVVQPGEIICVRCGTNLLTGHKIAEEQKTSPIRERRRWPWYVALIIVLFGLGVLAWQLPELLKGPVQKAQELAGEGKTLEATNVLREYLLAHNEDATAHFIFGKLRWSQGDYTEAAQSFEEAFRIDRGNLDAGWAAVVALRKQGGVSERLISILRRLTEAAPDDARTWRLLAMALMDSGDIDGQAVAVERALSLNPADNQVRLLQGILQIQKGDYAAAKDTLQAVSGVGGAGAAVALAVAAGFENSEDATPLWESAASAAPAGDAARTRLALSLITKGEFGQAEELLRTAAQEVRRDNIDAAFCHAVCLHALGQTAQATEKYSRILDLNGPHAQEAAVLLAELHLSQKNLERSRQMLTTARGLDQASGNDAQRRRITAMMNTVDGRLLIAEGQGERALEQFQRAAEADASFPGAALECGLNYIQSGAMTQGLAELKRYVDLTTASGGMANQEVELLIRQLEESAAAPPPASPPPPAAPAQETPETPPSEPAPDTEGVS